MKAGSLVTGGFALNADQLRAFSMALEYLSETEEWPAERDLLAEGARLLEIARAEKAEA